MTAQACAQRPTEPEWTLAQQITGHTDEHDGRVVPPREPTFTQCRQGRRHVHVPAELRQLRHTHRRREQRQRLTDLEGEDVEPLERAGDAHPDLQTGAEDVEVGRGRCGQIRP